MLSRFSFSSFPFGLLLFQGGVRENVCLCVPVTFKYSGHKY